jgi:hypothetical protein
MLLCHNIAFLRVTGLLIQYNKRYILKSFIVGQGFNFMDERTFSCGTGAIGRIFLEIGDVSTDLPPS